MKLILPKPKAFTLLELLVVLGIIGLFGGVMVSILFSLFRGSNKTSTLIILRQTGNYAIDQVTRTIRNAKALESPSPQSCNGTPIAGDTIILTTQDKDLNLQSTTLSCASNVLSVSDSTNGVVTSSKTLIDNTTVKASCDISCTVDSTSQVPVIDFSLHIDQKDAAASVENAAHLDFNTSIIMRNTD